MRVEDVLVLQGFSFNVEVKLCIDCEYRIVMDDRRPDKSAKANLPPVENKTLIQTLYK